ncbi:hypothetical protein [Ammoniphilus sp. YIM 78166]|uniref:hypothetical protein n=1 Tax=Ammoniphilus sp. YIM 78166 TaxID=1644106 RepID=UPI00107024B3|nr:hypothetical protein [Ammoniphilus sp. YIM 78166]
MLRIMLFYLPMGTSSLLAALTHVIINGVLARSAEPNITISSYAVAVSLAFLIDLPINVIKQTSSKYSRDQISFKTVAHLAGIVTGVLVLLSIIIGWTPAGQLLFHYIFGVKDDLLLPTTQVFQFLAFLYLFSALRSLFQGLIINQLRTGWMTVGMVIRVTVMFIMSWFFIRMGWTNDGRVGALIFMTGLAIECVVTVWEGLVLKRALPETQKEQMVVQTKQLLPFYLPLLYSSMVLVLLNPSIQATLNKTENPTLAVASYAVALQLSNMVIWFCASVHQIVLQFYETQPREVVRIVTFLSLLAPSILLTFASDALGGWMLKGILGLQGSLLQNVQLLLIFLAVHSFLFPWIDFVAGKCMLRGQTRAIMASKMISVTLSISLLILFLYGFPQLNGALAGLVAAMIAPLELLVIYLWLRHLEKRQSENPIEVTVSST